MLNVSEATKDLFKSDSIHKEMVVTVWDSNGTQYVFNNSLIYSESFELSETILDGTNMTFMGCKSSEMCIKLRNTANLKENAFDESPINVKITPYGEVVTKNRMPNLFNAGQDGLVNGLTYVVNPDLSITVSGTTTAEVNLVIADFTFVQNANLLLTCCPYGGGAADSQEGIFKIEAIDGTVTSFVDIGQGDIPVTIPAEAVCTYTIHIVEGNTLNVTFKPMLRDSSEDNTYENYGTKQVPGEQVPLFYGYVDSGEYDHDRSWLKITAYDVLYYLNSFNIWNWYKDVFDGGAKTLRYLLESFADYVNAESGYEFELHETDCPVILSDVKIKKQLNNKEMTATNFLKSFCQLACACALIDREGKLQLIYFRNATIHKEYLNYYREVSSKDYVIKPFSQGITIRTNSEDVGVTLTEPDAVPMMIYAWESANEVLNYTDSETPAAGDIIYDNQGAATNYTVTSYDSTTDSIVSNRVTYYRNSAEDISFWDDTSDDNYIIDDNDEDIIPEKYVIENNGLVKKLSKKKRKAIINILLRNVQTNLYAFKSYKLICNGLPYVECGDIIGYKTNESYEEVIPVDPQAGPVVIDNTDGDKAYLTFTWQALSNMTIYRDTYIALFNYKVVPPLVDQQYYGLSMQDMANVVDMSQVNAGDRLVMSHKDGVSYATYSRYENGEYTDYDVSNCMYRQGSTTWNCDIYLLADEAENRIQVITTAYYPYTGELSYTKHGERVKWEFPIVNRKLTGIQSMKDEFSFDLSNNSDLYGGTTSGLTDSNIAAESSTTAEALSGQTVITLVSFENGVLRTSSRKI